MPNKVGLRFSEHLSHPFQSSGGRRRQESEERSWTGITPLSKGPRGNKEEGWYNAAWLVYAPVTTPEEKVRNPVHHQSNVKFPFIW